MNSISKIENKFFMARVTDQSNKNKTIDQPSKKGFK